MEIEEKAGFGRCAISQRHLEPGSLVCTENPIAHVLNEKFILKNCSNCFRGADKLSQCSRCKFVRYCCGKCQVEDWRFHKQECSILQAVKRDVPTIVRLALRLHDISLATLQNNRGKYSEAQLEDLVPLIMVFRQCLSSVSVDGPAPTSIMDLFCTIQTNCIGIASVYSESIGLAMFQNLSMINHSCAPNAIINFDAGSAQVCAVSTIKKGEQMFIQYVDILQQTLNRKSELSETYYFDCACGKCSNKDDVHAGFKCPSCSRDIFVSDKFIDNAKNWKSGLNLECSNCECVALGFEQTLSKYLAFKADFEKLDTRSRKPDAVVDTIVAFTRIIDSLKRILTPTHSFLLVVYLEFQKYLCANELYAESVNVSRDVYIFYKTCLPPNYPVVVSSLYSLVKALQYDDTQDAVVTEKFRDLFQLCVSLYGSKHWLVEQVYEESQRFRLLK